MKTYFAGEHGRYFDKLPGRLKAEKTKPHWNAYG